MKNRKAQQASVLIVAVGVLVALTLMGVTFATLMRVELAASQNLNSAQQAGLIAQAGLEYAIWILRTDMYGTDGNPYNNDRTGSPDETFGSPARVNYWHNNDETYDSYHEKWMPGGGWFSKPDRNSSYASSGAVTGTGVPDPDENSVDNDGYKDTHYPGSGYAGYDSVWVDFPFPVASGRKAQVAILIKDFGASRLNVNYSWNNDGPGGLHAHDRGRYPTELATITASGSHVPGLVQPSYIQIVRQRHGTDNQPGSSGTLSARFRPLNPDGDDQAYAGLTAAELIYNTRLGSTLERAVTLSGGSVTTVTGQFLTPWSSDTLWTPFTSSPPELKTNLSSLDLAGLLNLSSKSWWRSPLPDSSTEWPQIAVNLQDYRDSDSTITVHADSGKCGLEAHPYITELFYRHVAKPNGMYRIELYNGFAHDISAGAFSLTVQYREYDPSTTSHTREFSVPAIGRHSFHTFDIADAEGFYFYQLVAELVGASGVIVDRANVGSAGTSVSVTAACAQRKRFNIEETDNWDIATAKEEAPDHDPPPANTLGAINSSADWHNTIRLLSVANESIYSLGQLADVLKIGYNDTDPYTVNADWIAACKSRTQTNLDEVFFSPLAAAEVAAFYDSLIVAQTGVSTPTNGYDDDGDGYFDSGDTGSQAGDIGGREIQAPGLININTASKKVLSYLPCYLNPSTGTWQTLGHVQSGSTTLAAAIVNYRRMHGAFTCTAELLRNVSEIQNALGGDGIDNDNDGKVDDAAEKALVFRNIANLITVRSHVFAVYVTARVIQDPNTDGIDNDGNGATDEANEADKIAGLNHDGIDNDGDGTTDEKGEADDCVNEIGRQKLVAVVDRSTDPVTIRFFRWVNDF